MRFICPECSSVVTCAAIDCGAECVCADCLNVVPVPAERCAPGAVIGDFVVKELIGSGGMGTVYLAEQLSLERHVALKILHPALAESHGHLKRFLNEAKLTASINHPNLIGVHATGEEDGLFYLAMEYIHGGSVFSLIQKDGRLPVGKAVDIVIQVASGLQAAWDRRGIVHCDIKPENILLPEDGGVKIADLGLAERTGSSGDASPKSETFAGSPYYVCPEVILGQPLDQRSDLYSLGATFFEMLTGHPPFQGDDATEVAGRHLYDSPPDPREFAPDIPPAISDILQKLLRKDPDERFQSGAELVDALSVDVLLRSTSGGHPVASEVRVAAASAQWRCPSCSRLNAEASRYCLDCGAYGWHPCPLCGEDIPINAQFCTHCGGNLVEQRQGILRQAEHLLQEMHEAAGANDCQALVELVCRFKSLDHGALPELILGQYHDVLSHLKALLETEVQGARDELSMDRLESSAARLYEVFGAEGYEWLKAYVDQLNSDLAQAVYQSGAALKSNCLATCRRTLAGVPQWRGGNLGARLEELDDKCDERMAKRDLALQEARAVLDSAQMDYGDAVKASWQLASFRISRKILVVAPNETDTKADAKLEDLCNRLNSLVREGVETWLEEEQWEAIADLLAVLRECEGTYLIDQEAFVSGCVKKEIRLRHQRALDAERANDVGLALECWDAVLEIPPKLLPRQIRREATGFPTRRSRLLTDRRRPALKSHLSIVFLLWCSAFALALLDLVEGWLDEAFEVTQLTRYGIPVGFQLVAIGLFAKLLRNVRVLSSGDVIPRREPPAFLTGVMLLWILSPLNGVVSTLFAKAGQLFPSVDYLAIPWAGPMAVGVLWLGADLWQMSRCRSPLIALGMTLSWGIALGLVYVLWGTPPDTAPLHVCAAMYQAIAFLVLHALNYWWWRKHGAGTQIHPSLAQAPR